MGVITVEEFFSQGESGNKNLDNLEVALQCLIGAIKDNTDAVIKMREHQEKTLEVLSKLAEDFQKRGPAADQHDLLSRDQNPCRASKRDKYSENGKPSIKLYLN